MFRIVLATILALSLARPTPAPAATVSVTPDPAHVGQVVVITVTGIKPGKLVMINTGTGLLAVRDGNRDGIASYSGWHYQVPGTYVVSVSYESNGLFIASGTANVIP